MSITNPSSSIKTRFAFKFLRAMKKLNKKKNRPANLSITEKYKRSNIIKVAAYSSMASAVGPKKAWTRAVLRKTRNRGYLMKKNRNIYRKKRKLGVVRGNPRKGTLLGFGQEEDLRGLVPGGDEMGFCRLLSETAHFIKCLEAQVQVMTKIVDHYST